MNKTSTVALSLAVLLMLAQFANAQSLLVQPCSSSSVINLTASWYCDYIYPNVQSTWSSWEPIAIIAVMASMMIATVIFILGIVLRNDRVRTFGIGEIYEAMASLVIVALFLFVSAVIFGLLPGIFVPVNPYNVSLTQINNTISQTEVLASSLFYAQMVPSFYSSISLTFCGPTIPPPQACFPVPQLWATPLMVLFVLPATAVTVLLIDGLLVLNTEFYAILFFMYAAIPVFLIPGTLLRAFLPTRSMGGMMVAIAIAFYMVMPLLFAIDYSITASSSLSTISTIAQQINAQSQGSNSQSNAITPTSPLVVDVGQIGSAMGSFWLTILFFPGLILAMTYGIVVTIADFIGGMASTSGRMRALV